MKISLKYNHGIIFIIFGSIFFFFLFNHFHHKLKITKKKDSVVCDIYKNKSEIDQITVVTAFVHLKDLPKTFFNNTRGAKDYLLWMETFANILNPVIAFFTNEEDAKQFVLVRNSKRELPTIIKITNFDNMRSFENIQDVADLYNKPFYPKYLPNTWDASYSCAMNAKYEFVNWASKNNPFKTKYFSWLDIGLFRELTKVDKPICLGLPEDFDECRVSYGVVHKAQMFDNKRIFYHNLVWVAGGYFVANRKVMKNWSEFYMEAVAHLLAQGLSNTDQQIVYAIRNTLINHNKTVPVKEHFWDGYRYNPWFFLAFKSRNHPKTCTIKSVRV